jgi:adenine-specific DNA-methyltransferase
VNFLNRKNEADQRVFQLLSEKFKLFEGVFGASDEVLGAIESGVDFEKRINDIYQRCRKTDEIKSAFDQLQLELSFEINEAMTRTRRKLLENFDDEVREKLRIQDEASRTVLNRFEQLLMRLTRHELHGCAEFLNDSSFKLNSCPFSGEIPLGLYELPRRSGEAHTYRLHHPLADAVVAQAKGRELPMAEIKFNYSEYEGKVSILEPFRGRRGRLALSLCSIESLDQAEDHLIFSAVTDDGHTLDEEFAHRLLSLPGQMGETMLPDSLGDLDEITTRRQAQIQHAISERNARLFEAEALKLDGWADDLKLGLEREIKELDRQIKEARRAATAAPTLEEKLAGQKQIKSLESQRNEKRRSLFDAQDEVDKQRDQLIAEIERKLQQSIKTTNLFVIRWNLS